MIRIRNISNLPYWPKPLALFVFLALFIWGINPPTLIAQQSWYHYDGFTLEVNDGVRIAERDSQQMDFTLESLRDPSIKVQGHVLPFGHHEFSDALVIHLAIDLFYEQINAFFLEGDQRRIETIEIEHQPDGDHWAIRIENRTFTWYYYIMPVNAPGGTMTHVMLVPQRPDDPGLNDLLQMIEGIEIIIEDAAG